LANLLLKTTVAKRTHHSLLLKLEWLEQLFAFALIALTTSKPGAVLMPRPVKMNISFNIFSNENRLLNAFMSPVRASYCFVDLAVVIILIRNRSSGVWGYANSP